ncbi:hypothetical protein ABZ930_12305 [Streptomyces sp. NPDC046716]|uniref:hypothetical protein n=1 Tax=Streptomyces sp. NPDC046716 TaxID=3157093 RepID=UPI0033CE50D1
MSSSADRIALDWSEFAERAVPEGGDEAVSPQAELAGVLQRRHEDLSAARGEAARAASGARDTVFELASLVGRLEQLIAAGEQALADSGQARLHRRLRILKEQMLQTLRDDGVEVRDPLGLPADEVADWSDPVGWRYGPQFTSETVAQTDEPAVFHHGAVVRLARVFMGSPEPGVPDQQGDAEGQGVAEAASPAAGPPGSSAEGSPASPVAGPPGSPAADLPASSDMAPSASSAASPPASRAADPLVSPAAGPGPDTAPALGAAPGEGPGTVATSAAETAPAEPPGMAPPPASAPGTDSATARPTDSSPLSGPNPDAIRALDAVPPPEAASPSEPAPATAQPSATVQPPATAPPPEPPPTEATSAPTTPPTKPPAPPVAPPPSGSATPTPTKLSETDNDA